MGRRKKEPQEVHRNAIAAAAGALFSYNGIAATTMDEIARRAGYSKATLYVYFQDKEELVDFLALKSMRQLLAHLAEAVAGPGKVKEKYDRICLCLTRYQAQSPFYFSLALGELRGLPGETAPHTTKGRLFAVGEEINALIAGFLTEGIRAGQFQPDIPVLPTVFLFWSTLSGLIQLAADKQAYLEQALRWPKQQFLAFGFERLYHMIAREEVE